MNDIRLIAVDLDGTLLNTNKELTPRTRGALAAAARAGIAVVPATGRLYKGIPEPVRSLPFIRYAITMNGAHVLDLVTGETVYAAEVSTEDAIAFYTRLDPLPVIYDCYINDWGYMTEEMQRRAEEYAPDEHILKLIRELRSPVPELKAFIREGNHRLQKLQVFTRKDTAYRDVLMRELAEEFPQFAVSWSLPDNIEVNSRLADKGRAIHALAARLGLRREQTMVFGDGLNDLTMLQAAGVAVAMENGCAEVKAAADRIAPCCDEDGVAAVIEEVLAQGGPQGS